MKQFIEVTSSKTNKKIHINIDMIGDVSSYVQNGSYVGYVEGREVTKIGCVTHNNGGFDVLETVDEVLKKIKSFQ